MKKIVFFDLDGTVIPLSSEQRFVIWLILHGYVSCKQWYGFAKFIFKYFHKYGMQVFLKNKAYLWGLAVPEIDKLAREFATHKLIKTIRPKIKKIIEEHLANEDRVILLSATLEPIAEIFAEFLQIPEVIATKPAQELQIFRAVPPVQHPYSQDKLRLAQQFCQDNGIAISECIAYGNSIHDLHLLERVGKPVAVTPDRKLHKIATQRKWDIIV